MRALLIVGVIMAAGVICTDKFIVHLPHWLAVVLYTAALALIITGMIVLKLHGE